MKFLNESLIWHIASQITELKVRVRFNVVQSFPRLLSLSNLTFDRVEAGDSKCPCAGHSSNQRPQT